MTANRRRAGFTLLEILMVLLIVGILTMAVGVSLRGPYRLAQFDQFVGLLETVDRTMRSHARRFARPSVLVFDLDRREIFRLDPVSGDRTGESFRIPASSKIEEILFPWGRITDGQATIACDRSGRTQTYAIGMTNAREQEEWIVFSGITGQSIRTKEEREIDALFKILSPTGA